MTFFLPLPRSPKGLSTIGERGAESVIGFQDCWPGPTNRFQFFSAPQSLEVVSGSADNKGTPTAGTGARSLRLVLLDATFSRVQQDVILDGTTPVAVPGGPYMRCLGARVLTAGSYGFVQTAEVDLRIASGGAVLQRLLSDTNKGRATTWTFTPDQYPWGIIGWGGFISQTTQSTVIKFELQIRNFTQDWAWEVLDFSPELNDQTRSFNFIFTPNTADIKTDIYDMRVSFQSDKASTKVENAVFLIRNEPGIATFSEVL